MLMSVFSVCVYIYSHTYIVIYIYIERERHKNVHMYMYTEVCVSAEVRALMLLIATKQSTVNPTHQPTIQSVSKYFTISTCVGTHT